MKKKIEIPDDTLRWEKPKGGFLFRFEARLVDGKLVVMYYAKKERNGDYSYRRPAAGYLDGKVYFRKHSFTRGLCSRLAHSGVQDISVTGDERGKLDELAVQEAALNGETIEERNKRYRVSIERDQSVAFSALNKKGA